MSACTCVSHRGHPKQKYRSFEHADRIATRRGWMVEIYPCPYRAKTYHITHRKTPIQEAPTQ